MDAIRGRGWMRFDGLRTSDSELILAESFARCERMLTDIELTEECARTNIAKIHEEGPVA